MDLIGGVVVGRCMPATISSSASSGWAIWRAFAIMTVALAFLVGLFGIVNPGFVDQRGTVFWGSFGMVLLAVGILYAILVPRERVAWATHTSETSVRAVGAEPFGDVHRVIDVEGLGTRQAAKLRAMGIHDTRELWRANPSQVAHHLGVAPTVVQQWQAMAELMAVRGIGPQYAEALVRAGIDTIEALRNANPEGLSRAIAGTEGGRGRRIQGNVVSPKVAQNWIEAAREHQVTVQPAPLP